MKTFIVYIFWMAFSSLLVKIGFENATDMSIGYFGILLVNVGIQFSTVIPVGILASIGRKDAK